MRIGILLILMVFALLAAFVVLNWSAFIAVVPLSLGITSLQAPLGLIMLVLLFLLAGPVAAYALYLRYARLIKAGRYAEQLQNLHELAEQAEKSRYTELRGFLSEELHKLKEQHLELQTELHSGLSEFAELLAGMAARSSSPETSQQPQLAPNWEKEEPAQEDRL